MTASSATGSGGSSATTASTLEKGGAWKAWANQALDRAGSRERIHKGSLEQQYWDALEAGDERDRGRRRRPDLDWSR